MILVEPPSRLKLLLRRYTYEPLNNFTLQNIKNTLDSHYGYETPLKISAGYDYYGYLDIRFEFESEEDAVIFMLKFGT